jgi:probable rRNA maturation factor
VSVTIDILIEEQTWLQEITDVEAFICRVCEVTLLKVFIAPQVKETEISVVLADDPYIQELNHRYRHMDKPTNVLSFPSETLKIGEYSHLPRLVILGDIVLAYRTIAREAKEQQKPIKSHLAHMVVHSVLHLLGYDHEKEAEAQQMESMEINILQQLKVENPYL